MKNTQIKKNDQVNDKNKLSKNHKPKLASLKNN